MVRTHLFDNLSACGTSTHLLFLLVLFRARGGLEEEKLERERLRERKEKRETKNFEGTAHINFAPLKLVAYA